MSQLDTIQLTNTLNQTTNTKRGPLMKRPIAPLVEVLSINTIINRYDYWVLNADWAYVSWGTWGDNIRRGFETDGDAFGTNFFGHPFHGSFFFNAARSNGRSFWGSIPYIALGSLSWEYFGENESPSEIDMGTTVYGGLYLGEITHRLSTHLLSRAKYKKGKKLLSSLTSIIINPIGQFNSLLHDDIYDSYRKDINEEFPIRSQFSVGVNLPFGNINDKDASTRLHVNYSMIYGDIFNNMNKYKPLDFFILRSWIDISSVDKERPVFFNVMSHAPLWRKKINATSIFALSNHFDFLNNEVFKIGVMSITGDYILQTKIQNTSILGSAKLGMILFGSSNSEVAQFVNTTGSGSSGSGDNFFRDYVYGRGVTFELETLITFSNNSRVLLNYNNWTIYTKEDAEGTENSSVLEFNYFYPIFKRWSLGLQAYYYKRTAEYLELPQFALIENRYVELKIMATITF